MKYVMTSKGFSGSVIFGFSDEDGKLTYYQNESDMNEKQSKWLFSHFPFSIDDLHSIKVIIQGRLELVPQDTSFEAFWDAYSKKVSKKRCEPLWKKMNEAERIECIMSIRAYDNYLKRMNGRAKLDPENYLKREAYKNTWNQLTT